MEVFSLLPSFWEYFQFISFKSANSGENSWVFSETEFQSKGDIIH